MGYRSWRGKLVAMLHSWVDTTEKGLRRCWGLEKLPEEGVGKGSPRKGKGWKWVEIYEAWGILKMKTEGEARATVKQTQV